MRRITVNMPQMAVVGLSENWLLRHCGDRHWSSVCESLGIRSGQLENAEGERLYASFVAIRERFDRPLTHFRENDVLDERLDLKRYGKSIFASQTSISGPGAAAEIQMVTKFVSRERAESNRLKLASLGAEAESTAEELAQPPPLAIVYQQVKSGLSEYEIEGMSIPTETGPSARERLTTGTRTRIYEPNPYVDYNGAGLLYFASYPTIADHLERLHIEQHGTLAHEGDWAAASSTVARDIFYFGNLDLGDALFGIINHARIENPTARGPNAVLHSSLFSANQERLLAEIFSVKEIVS